MGRAYAQDAQGWKRWGVGGWGLGSMEHKGPRRAPHPCSQRTGDPTWEPSRLPGLTGAEQTPSSPAPPVLEGPSHLPLLISLASLLCPQGPRGLEWALEGGRSARELSRLLRPQWAEQTPRDPLPLLWSWRALPPASPVLSRPPSYVPRTNPARRGPLRV